MKFHKRLTLIVGINIVISFLFSYILDKFEGDHHDYSAVGINSLSLSDFWHPAIRQEMISAH